MLDDDQVGEGGEERVNEQSGDPISSGIMGLGGRTDGGDFVDDDGAADGRRRGGSHFRLMYM